MEGGLMRTSVRAGWKLFHFKNHLRKALLCVALGFVLDLAGLTGCRGSVTLGEGTPALELTSSSFRGGEMPKKFTCDGGDGSPELAWGAPPAGTQSFALIAVDRDSPLGYSFVHWVLYDRMSRRERLMYSVGIGPPEEKSELCS
jgi:hypothetical protein